MRDNKCKVCDVRDCCEQHYEQGNCEFCCDLCIHRGCLDKNTVRLVLSSYLEFD